MAMSAAAQSMDSMGAASIQSATALLEGVFERDFIGGQSAKARAFSLDDRRYQRNAFIADRAKQWRREDSQYQRAVRDAQRAGLHPLFALGKGGYGQGGGAFFRHSLPGSPSGGSAKTGIAAAGRAVAGALRGRVAAAMQVERHKSEIAVNEALANKYNSEAARAAQRANTGPRMTESGAVVIPYGDQAGVPLSMQTTTPRATRIEPRVNAPLWTTVEKPGGGTHRVLHESLQADELNMLLIAAQGTYDYFHKAATAIGFKPWEAGQQAYRFFRNMAQKPKRRATTRRGHPRRNY